MKLRPNRGTERAAVNATQAFFEANECVFQSVDGANDYGKDAYVDLTSGGCVTGLCAALQIKGGRSYRTPSGGYRIPLDESHAATWRDSTIPIFGIVHDPDDNQLRWCNISDFLTSAEGGRLPTSIPVEPSALLTPTTLHRGFRVAIERSRLLRGEHPLLQIFSESTRVRHWAIQDCLALGRSDPRVLIALRYLVSALHGEEVVHAVLILSHATPHPDIFWHPGNWIPPAVEKVIAQHFRWGSDEIALLLEQFPLETFERGQPGQAFYMLLMADPERKTAMRRACVVAMEAGRGEAAFTALYLWLYWERRNAKAAYEAFRGQYPAVRELPNIEEFEDVLRDCDREGGGELHLW